MRNWHIIMDISKDYWFCVVHCLWGIDTTSSGCNFCTLSFGCTLPKRNWHNLPGSNVFDTIIPNVVHCLRGIEKVNIRMTKRPVAYHVVCLFSWKRKNHAPEFFGSIFLRFFWVCGNFLKYRFHINSEEERSSWWDL